MRALRLILLTIVLSVLLAAVAQAAPIGALKQYRLPTPTAPRGTSPTARMETAGSPRARSFCQPPSGASRRRAQSQNSP